MGLFVTALFLNHDLDMFCRCIFGCLFKVEMTMYER